MAGRKTEHQVGVEVGGVDNKGRDRPQSVINFLHGGDTGSNPLFIGALETFGGDGENGGGDSHQVSEEYHREGGAAEGI